METYKVGDRVHYDLGTDVFPATVVRVSEKYVTIREDKFKVDPEWKPDFIPGGFVGHVANNYEQKNIITEDPEGTHIRFSLREVPKNIRDYHKMSDDEAADKRRWIMVGGGGWRTGAMLRPGWHAFRDYNF